MMRHDPGGPAPAILWFRRDLRLEDNLALAAALQVKGPVVCVYIRDTPLAGALGAAQAWWLHHSLVALDTALRARGNRLVLLSGDPQSAIDTLLEETGARSVFWNRRYDPDGMRTDIAIKSALTAKGVDARSFSGFLLHEPSRVKTKQGKPYAVFTPFWRALEAQFVPTDPLAAPVNIPVLADGPEGEKIEDWKLTPSRPDWASRFSEFWQPGEQGALSRLEDFLGGAIDGYKSARDFPGKAGTSALSPHLAMGEISPHRVWRATTARFDPAFTENIAGFRRELAWRDFAWHLLFHRPDMPHANMDRRFDAFPWSCDTENFKAWQRGRTGYPIVDAGMRELWQTGYMHNRVRMIVASFLIKDLLVDWREGERWFRDTLLDADCASNAMNWQWVAGCGADAAPWFRIFNPVKQGETFDPDGAYVRRFCPELASLPDKYIHRPFEAPPGVLQKAGILPGETYPMPLVAHDLARERALAAFRSLADAAARSA